MYVFSTRAELDTAISSWRSNEDNAKTEYGDINTWDVSAITDFSYLIPSNYKVGVVSYYYAFNSDISNWDVSNGTDFSHMFSGITNFNQDISNWDVSNGTDFSNMFNLSLIHI